MVCAKFRVLRLDRAEHEPHQDEDEQHGPCREQRQEPQQLSPVHVGALAGLADKPEQRRDQE